MGLLKSAEEAWMADPISVVQEMFSELNWEYCEPWPSSSDPIGAGIGESQECDRALCAMELVFLNILQIAHESCTNNIIK